MNVAASTPDRSSLVKYFDALAPARVRWVERNRYYHRQLGKTFSFFIPPNRSVLEIGCGAGQLLASLKPGRGVGIDLSPKMIQVARERHPHLEFHVDNLEDLQLEEKFDYVVVSDVLGFLYDVQRSLENLRRVCSPHTRVVISYYNFLWEPVLNAGERLGLKARQPIQNWLGAADVANLLDLAGFEVIRKTSRLLLPKRVPLLSLLCNRFLVNLPVFRHLALTFVIVARPKPVPRTDHPSCSVVIPARNERGNVEEAIRRTPQLGRHTEIIFVEGNSDDGTAEEIQRAIAAHPERDLKFIPQGSGRGKGCRAQRLRGRDRRRVDDPRCRPHRAAGRTAKVLQRPDHRPRGFHPRLPARLPDARPGDALSQHPRQQVFQPRVHLPA